MITNVDFLILKQKKVLKKTIPVKRNNLKNVLIHIFMIAFHKQFEHVML